MEIKVIRLAIGSLQSGYSIAPRIVVLLALSEIMQRRQPEEVERTQIGYARAEPPVAGN